MNENEEYVNIMEAARRCKTSDKTVRRAIAAHKLPAQRPKPNVVLIAVSDLEVWHDLKTDTTDRRIATLEQQVQTLERQVQQLAKLVGQLSRQDTNKPDKPGQPLEPLAEVMHLNRFADLHGVSRNEAEGLWKTGFIKGQREPGKRRGSILIHSEGMCDFWVQFHDRPDFRACDHCPHNQDSSLDRGKLKRIVLVKHDESSDHKAGESSSAIS